MADLASLRTPSGKSTADFSIDPQLLESNPRLVQLIIRSRAMNDAERQYWFNLIRVMKQEQVAKLQQILEQEKQGETQAAVGEISTEEALRMAEERQSVQQKIREAEEAKQSGDIIDLDSSDIWN
ncbi:hypothetical protein H6771_02730 [Candidatus Peribacteria bacterium]|nr:hypothetical protein [Candidatus Peribacteria bacterium]